MYVLGVRFLVSCSRFKERTLKALFLLPTALLMFGFQIASGQTTPWLTDDQARDVVAAAIHSVHPEPCYSTYRNESLESSVLDVRKNRIVDSRLNNSVYFYRVASDVCEYVVEESGKAILRTQVSNDCCEYGIVAVDRGTAKAYWFRGEKRGDIFKEFVRDEQLQPDSSEPTLYTALYRELVWGGDRDTEIRSLSQVRDLAQSNFQSAYSPYERDNRWQRKFDAWWRKFQSKTAQLKLETTYELTSLGTIVRGYSFNGFDLTIPRSDPPPKGTPKLFQWALLVNPDGTIEERPSKIIYSSR